MSVIAVRKYLKRKQILLSADVQTTWGDAKLVDAKHSMYLEPAKIWAHNGLAVGSAGYVSTATLFRVFTKTRKPATADVEGMIELLVDFTDWAKKKDSNFKLENQFIIVFEGKIFQCNGYSVQEVSEYNAIGSGMFLALGAMWKGSEPDEAIEVAKQFDLFCGGETSSLIIVL